MHGLDFLLLAALAVIVGLAVRRLVKNRLEGRSCCGDCAACRARERETEREKKE